VITQKIHEIWSRQLNLENFSDEDDFFDLGGHSLIMAEIQQAIVREFGVEVPMDELFRRSTVTSVAACVGSLAAVP
jgi:acyl carrier protein